MTLMHLLDGVITAVTSWFVWYFLKYKIEGDLLTAMTLPLFVCGGKDRIAE